MRHCTFGKLAQAIRAKIPRSSVFCTIQLLLLTAVLAQPRAGERTEANNSAARSSARISERVNAGSLGIISGGADGTYIRVAADLANVLDGENLRILPTIGRGSLQNLRDIMFLRGIDIGIVQMDAREALKAEGLEEQALSKLRYIARLYNEEVHVLADLGIHDLRQLEGQKVNIDKPGSGTNLTARLIFDKLGVKPEFTTYDQASSYERLRSGELRAAVYVAGRPVRAISEFRTGDRQFQLLPIPFDGGIAESYFPAKFTAADYPHLISAGTTVDTLAVGSILAVFNWPERSDRYKRVERFVNAFFSKFDEFMQPGRHPKWKEVSLTADVPGWQRSKAAQQWIDNGGLVTAARASAEDLQTFLASKGVAASPATRERLFQEFLAWHRHQSQAATGSVR